MLRIIVTAAMSVLLATTAAAQSSPWQFWLRAQPQTYDNFFQRSAGQPQEDVRAFMGELGANVRLSRTTPLRAYGSVNYMRFDYSGLQSSPGVRVGLRLDGRPHAFDVHAERLRNRPSFDIGDEFDQADIRNLAGEYSYRFTRDWQVSVEGELQKQQNEFSSSRDNDYRNAGAGLRWRRYRVFSPEIGFRRGTRDVVDDTLSYDQRETYLQVRSAPRDDIYLSVRFRDRSRDYTTDREDKRRQISATADWSMTPRLTWNLYASRENVDVNRAGRDFTTGMFVLGATWRF